MKHTVICCKRGKITVASRNRSTASRKFICRTVGKTDGRHLPIVFMFRSGNCNVSIPGGSRATGHGITSGFSNFGGLHVVRYGKGSMFSSVGTVARTHRFTVTGHAPIVMRTGYMHVNSRSGSSGRALCHSRGRLTCIGRTSPLVGFHQVLLHCGHLARRSLRRVRTTTGGRLTTTGHGTLTTPSPVPRDVCSFILPRPCVPRGCGSKLPKPIRNRGDFVIGTVGRALGRRFHHGPSAFV